jgi:hypothetical protein
MTPKLVQDIMGYKWKKITSGGVTLFATTFDPKEGDFVVGWGQGASCGELALGAGAVRPIPNSLAFILTDVLSRSSQRRSRLVSKDSTGSRSSISQPVRTQRSSSAVHPRPLPNAPTTA